MTEEAIRNVLAHLPKTLSETYSRIIHKTCSSPCGAAKFDTMCAVFRWICVARRPLRLDELEEAVALTPDDTYLHTDRIPRNSCGRLISSCGNLAIYDEEENTVSFAHHTVKQFLLSSQQHGDMLPFPIDLRRSEEDVGGMCLAYLGFSDFETQVAQAPLQTPISPALAESVVWSNVPFATRFRDALSWTASWRGIAGQDLPTITFAAPVSSAPTGLLMRQYVLLEYVVENWVHHTSGIRRETSTCWSKFEHIALERQLAFEFRPWNDQTHRSRTKVALHNLEISGSGANRPRSTLILDGPAAIIQLNIYAWALRYAVGSLFGLLQRPVISGYLDLIRNDITLAGAEHVQISSDLVLHAFERFPLIATVSDPLKELTAWKRTGWTGDLLVQILKIFEDGHNMLDAKLLHTFLGLEICRWLEKGYWDSLQVDAAGFALRLGHHPLFDCVYQLAVGDNTAFASATDAYWQTQPSSKIAKRCLTRSTSGALLSSSFEWDTVFLIDRYYSEDKIPLWISELLAGTDIDLHVSTALIVVALAHGKSLSYVTHMLESLEPNPYHTLNAFLPLGDWKASSFGSLSAYQRLSPFLWVDVRSLVRELNNATKRFGNHLQRYGTRRYGRGSQDGAWSRALIPIIKIWKRHNEAFLVGSLEKDGIYLLKWVVYYQAPGALKELLPMYRKYAHTEEGRILVLEILDEFDNASPGILEQVQSLLHPEQEQRSDQAAVQTPAPGNSTPLVAIPLPALPTQRSGAPFAELEDDSLHPLPVQRSRIPLVQVEGESGHRLGPDVENTTSGVEHSVDYEPEFPAQPLPIYRLPPLPPGVAPLNDFTLRNVVNPEPWRVRRA
jgi:hypothetical protein